MVAGHKGHPDVVADKGRPGRRNRLRGERGRGTLDKEKPPILGLIQRGGQIVIQMLSDVRRATIEPLIKGVVRAGALICTDEYVIYDLLEEWGYAHKSVNHGAGEYGLGRGRGRLLRGPRQHDGGLLVAAAQLAAPAPGRLAGEAAALPGLLRVHPQCPEARQGLDPFAD